MLTRRQMVPALAAPLLAQARKPNIVLIVSDDHHWQCLGAAGNPNIRTPNLDKLATRGVLFTQGIISTPQCAPSRGILLSGQETYQTGLDCNDHTAFRTFDGATVVEQLRRGGYATNLIGKWHIRNTPKECGFTKAPLWLAPGGSRYRNPMLRHGLEAAADTETPGHITELFSSAAVDVVQQAQQPYLLWLTYNAPHTPWTASDPYRKLYAGRNAELAPPNHPKPGAPTEPRPAAMRAGLGNTRPDGGFDWETYYAVISELDAGIGRVADAIEKAGQWDNTLILFLGDNGYLCGSKGLQGKVYPWEESIRIPFLASGGLVKKAARSDAPVASIDIPATMLDVAGIRPGHKLSGSSLRPAWSGGRFARDAAFAVWNDGRPQALVAGYPVEPYRVVRTSTEKYILWESKKEALFDLKTDPFERTNLALQPAQAGRLKAVKNRLRARMKETDDAAAAWL
ncbi:MAG: sulfatase-like hydrolase/transferase [Bryobacter sp.]|nr:sulfatase-like hydrolase/transferase [Bryobacter sp.]